jgi:hypothetical protein
MVGFHNKPSLTPRPSSRPACCATCRHARLRLRGLSGPRDVRVKPMRGWVFSASAAGRRCRKSPKAPRPATPAALHRPLPISASSDSPTAYWPDTGVRHGPYAQHGQRTGPQGTPRCHRVLGKAHLTSQTPKGPLFRPRCSPDGRNMKIHTFRSNRAPRTHFSSRSTHQRPPSPDPGGLWPSGMLINPI